MTVAEGEATVRMRLPQPMTGPCTCEPSSEMTTATAPGSTDALIQPDDVPAARAARKASPAAR